MKTNSTPREELMNVVTCAFGILVSAFGGAFLLRYVWNPHDMVRSVGFVIFIIALILTYIVATLYHAFFFTRAKKIFRILDHGVIYLYIAGGYTPFVLSLLRRDQAFIVLFFIWLFAALGIIFQVFKMHHNKLSLLTYFGFICISFMGIRILFLRFPLVGIALLLLAGFFALVGMFFYANKKMYMNHFIWHVFVLLATACHFGALFFLK